MQISNASLTLRISEIFFSLQGETSRVGIPTIFIRLTGCPLRCTYCDTTYAFSGGSTMSLDEIMQAVKKFPATYICVTGGEPLAQKNCLTLMTILCNAGYLVSLETSGALDVSTVDARVSKILDLKTPSSGEMEKNWWPNMSQLNSHDEIKFVVCDKEDYEWVKQVINYHNLTKICGVLLSPAQDQLEAQTLAEWILKDALPVRLQVQLHKLLWGNQRGK